MPYHTLFIALLCFVLGLFRGRVHQLLSWQAGSPLGSLFRYSQGDTKSVYRFNRLLYPDQ